MTKIFFVDDDADIRRLTKECFVTLGHECMASSSAEEAIHRFSKYKPDLLILDYHLPDRNGLELYRELLSLGAREIPAILLTSECSEKVTEEALGLGVSCHLEKPFGMKELHNIARNLIRLRQAEGENRDLAKKLEQQLGKAKELNQKLLELQTRLAARERLAALGEVSGNIAHELNSPLGALQANLKVLEKRLESFMADDTLEILEECGIAILHIREAIFSLKQAAQPEYAVSMNRLGSVNLEIENVLRLMKHKIPPGVRVETTLQLGSHVQFQAPQIHLILRNLLENAIDAVGNKGLIQITNRPTQNGFIVEVRDSGQGLTEAEKGKVFEPFYSSKTPEKGFLGLGLSLCRTLTDSLGGQIEISNSDKGGAIATVTFPKTTNSSATLTSQTLMGNNSNA